MEFEFKTKPFDHQMKTWRETRDVESHALFWEQGTCKTKPVIDTAAWQYIQGDINTALIVAPKGVERNWLNDEIPIHLPEAVASESLLVHYQSIKNKTQWHQRMCKRAIKHKGMVFAAMGYDAFVTKHGKQFAWELMKNRDVMHIADESADIANPKASRTKSILKSAQYSKARRVLDGTPVDEGPFNVWSQIEFVDPTFWKKHRLSNYHVFRHYFGIIQRRKANAGHMYEHVVDYRYLEELGDILKEISSRYLKDEVLDLPPKLYSKRYFDPTKEQTRLYEELKTEFMTELNGDLISAPMAIVRLLRLQQILCGYLPSDGGDPVHIIEGGNPRLELLVDIANRTPHQGIIWARFHKDVDLIMEQLGGEAVRYDGKVSDANQERAKVDFQAGKYKWFVGNPASGGRGLTLTAARTVVYYNNSFKLRHRRQSEDRPHRQGQEHPVGYIDIVAPNTVDMDILQSLRDKIDIASKITGDKLREWL